MNVSQYSVCLSATSSGPRQLQSTELCANRCARTPLTQKPGFRAQLESQHIQRVLQSSNSTQIVKKLPAFYGTRRFINKFSKAHWQSQPCTRVTLPQSCYIANLLQLPSYTYFHNYINELCRPITRSLLFTILQSRGKTVIWFAYFLGAT